MAVLESETRKPKNIASWILMTNEQVHEPGSGNNRRANLDSPAKDDHAPCTQQFLKGEFKTDGKEQQDDADLADSLDRGLVAYNGKCVGTGEHADHKETDDAWDLKALPQEEKENGENAQTDYGQYDVHIHAVRGFPGHPLTRITIAIC